MGRVLPREPRPAGPAHRRSAGVRPDASPGRALLRLPRSAGREPWARLFPSTRPPLRRCVGTASRTFSPISRESTCCCPTATRRWPSADFQKSNEQRPLWRSTFRWSRSPVVPRGHCGQTRVRLFGDRPWRGSVRLWTPPALETPSPQVCSPVGWQVSPQTAAWTPDSARRPRCRSLGRAVAGVS